MGILEQIQELRAAEENAQATVADRVPGASVATKSAARSGHVPSRESVIGAPHHRSGENTMGSRPFSYSKALGMISGAVRPDQCRTEVDVLDGFTKSIREQFPEWSPMPGCYLLPFSVSLLPQQTVQAIKSLGFVEQYQDPDEVRYTRQQLGLKTMTTTDYSAGGAMVPTPAWGSFIQLARNTPGLFAAGAQTFPIPPQGAIEFPRGKTATTADTIATEDSTYTESDYGTDSMKLEAKMIGAGATLSNKLMMMSNPAAEVIVQEDLMQSVLLKLDYLGFFGPGGAKITGIINQPGVNLLTPSTVGTDGDTLEPQDWFNLFWTKCAQANRQFTGWVMNPRSFASMVTKRSDAVSAADAKGLFVNAPFTPLGKALEDWYGFKTTWTNQIPVNGTKGAGTTLTHAFGGPWNEAVVGLFGAVQVLINPYETTAYSKVQTKIRVTALGDFGLRYPTAFSYAKQLTN
jgi:HK97 family phage major capsid protein